MTSGDSSNLCRSKKVSIILKLTLLCPLVDNNPNIDFFTRDELKVLVEEFKKKEDERLDASHNSSMSNPLDNSTAKLFDANFFKTQRRS